jgi:hypothetical protein
MGFTREQVYIANVVKCRPPGNRQPAPDEAATCIPYLHRQLEIIQPRVIVTLGLSAARYMLDTKLSMTRLRGNWHTLARDQAHADVPSRLRIAPVHAGDTSGSVERFETGSRGAWACRFRKANRSDEWKLATSDRQPAPTKKIFFFALP